MAARPEAGSSRIVFCAVTPTCKHSGSRSPPVPSPHLPDPRRRSVGEGAAPRPYLQVVDASQAQLHAAVTPATPDMAPATAPQRLPTAAGRSLHSGRPAPCQSSGTAARVREKSFFFFLFNKEAAEAWGVLKNQL